jgi:uncharacterized membrane protein YfbV (UPF0208 family)
MSMKEYSYVLTMLSISTSLLRSRIVHLFYIKRVVQMRYYVGRARPILAVLCVKKVSVTSSKHHFLNIQLYKISANAILSLVLPVSYN